MSTQFLKKYLKKLGNLKTCV